MTSKEHWWTPERDEQLFALLKEVHAAEAARRLGVSRHTIVGRVYRLRQAGVEIKLLRHPKSVYAGKKYARPASLPSVSAPRPVPSTPEPVELEPAVEAAEGNVKEIEASFTTAEAVAALEYRHCKWPIGDPLSPDFRFCCAERAPERPYCTGHIKEAYTGGWKPARYIRKKPSRLSLASGGDRWSRARSA